MEALDNNQRQLEPHTNMYPVTVLLHVLGQLLVFLSDLAVLLF